MPGQAIKTSIHRQFWRNLDFHETFETNHGLEDGIIPTAFTEMHYVNISLNGRHTHTTVVSSDCNRAEMLPVTLQLTS